MAVMLVGMKVGKVVMLVELKAGLMVDAMAVTMDYS